MPLAAVYRQFSSLAIVSHLLHFQNIGEHSFPQEGAVRLSLQGIAATVVQLRQASLVMPSIRDQIAFNE